ncbi:glycosyltransferase family 2 protein [Aquidulcibacter sp.]|uniref:glycosyltransferase family 2 protein n=1 Tax=Aquidulcibacter sp. TaxID=2052990 RepID=UPI0025C5FE20|nr:glycosyltransferase family 2 protein [Aquidulcibacter sp.]MCA3693910.1 glycosyltransferase family 2 protein [Aquidulcibacter sp.]
MSSSNPSVSRLEPLDISVVVPVHNESGAVAGLVQEIAAALDGWAYEMIFVDDASKDDTHAKLVALKATYPALRVLANRKNAGQSRAIMNGVLAARAPVIGTLDGDGQNDPADLPALLQQLNRPDAPQGLAFVGGRRVKRQDSQAKKIASRFANQVRQALLRDGADDSGCGIKVIRRELFLRLPYFDHMHRYMPALVQREGALAEFAVVNHRHRSTGASKYTNLGRLLAALTDLGGVIWLRTRRRDFGHVDET